jgi:hypothetical protein
LTDLSLLKGGRAMNKKRNLFVLLVIFSGLLLMCCAPKTFVRTPSPDWNMIEMRDEVPYDEAWKSVVDLIAKKFDIEILSKEDGYIRTGWLHSWTGNLTQDYKVRCLIKFNPDKRIVEVKSEAQFYDGGYFGIGAGWVMGTDELLSTTLRSEIMERVGRLSR